MTMPPIEANQVTRDRVEALIAAYGADPLRWPEGERAAAQSYLEAHPEMLASELEDSFDLDHLLSQADVPTLSSSMMTAMAAQARPSWKVRLCNFLDWHGPLWQPAGALAAALMFGAVLGLADPDTAAAISSITGLEPQSLVTPDSELDFDPFGEDGL